MMTGIVKRIGAGLLALVLLLGTASQVWAAEPATLELQAPQSVTLGDQVGVTAVLRNGNGAPIPRATINLWSAGSFLSVGGAIQLGEATTDAQGRAVFLYEARIQESATLTAHFPGDTRFAPTQGSVTFAVQGSAQLYQSTAGIQVPGLGVWILVGVLSVVWTIYLTVMVFLTLIAKEGPKPLPSPGGRRG